MNTNKHEHECGSHDHGCSCHEHHQHECGSHDHGCSCHEHHQHECGSHDHGCSCHEHHQHDCGCGHEHHGHTCGCGHHHEHHDHGCTCGHDHGDDGAAKKQLPRLLLALLLFAVGMILPAPQGLKTALLLACYAVSGYEVIISAWRSLIRGRMLDENFLMTAASLAAIGIGEMTEGCAVMLFYQVGECCQAYAVGRSRKRIKALLSLKAEEAFVLRGGEVVSADPAEVMVGEQIRVRPGERVPLDAVVLTGMSEMDTSALTGESLPRTAETGDVILAGFISCSGVVTARVEKPLAESSVSRILSMVERAQERKAPVERFITVFARVYTPIVVGLAALLAVLPPMMLGNWQTWIYRALTFLVASCPCALVISVPLCYFAGIGSAARQGVLIKGGDSLDALCRVKAFVLDKTGTLTTGAFRVQHVHPAKGYSEADVLAVIAGAERDSNHPLAIAALQEAKARGVEAMNMTLDKEISGRGICAKTADGKLALAGSEAMMRENGVSFDLLDCDSSGARIYAALDGKAVGCLCLSDAIKPGAKQALDSLKALGVRTVMLTGDREDPAQAVAQALGIEEVHAQLLPGEKLNKLENLLAQGGCAFVGDGINDAPALVRSDVGIAMGALGSDAAIEAADIVLMTDELDRLPQALSAARRVRMLARQNVGIALLVKIAVLLLAMLGAAGMWAAVFADVGVALICVLNSMRAMR